MNDIYDRMKKKLFKLSSRTYKPLKPLYEFKTQTVTINKSFQESLNSLIEYYPIYKSDDSPDVRNKYNSMLSQVNGYDDQLKDLSISISSEIQRTAKILQREDIEVNQLKNIYEQLQEYSNGTAPLDTTSSQMLTDYDLIVYEQNITFWIYIIIICIFTYIFIFNTSTKLQNIWIIILTVIFIYSITIIIKWIYRQTMLYPLGPHSINLIEPDYDNFKYCSGQECCDSTTTWTNGQCIANTL